jgi:hypothetical protein
MKGLVLLFFAMFSFFVLVEQNVLAEAPSMCVVEDSAMTENDPNFEDFLLDAKYTCRQLERVASGIDGAVIAVQAGTLISACSGAGAPVAVSLEAGALVLQTIKLMVSNLPCEDTNEKKIEANLKLFVCDQLADKGITHCNL